MVYIHYDEFPLPSVSEQHKARDVDILFSLSCDNSYILLVGLFTLIL